jgi:hypothetical protein
MYLQEISLIILQVLFIYLFFNNSIFNEKIINKIIKVKYFTNIDFVVLNVIIFLNLLILVSVFSVNSTYFFYIYILLISLALTKNFLEKIKINFNYKNIIIVFIFFILSLDLAYELIFGWDVQWFWYFKALNFYQDQNFSNLNTLPVSGYPHLGPYIWGFFWKFPFNSYEYLGRIVYIFFYILAIFSFAETLKINNQLRSIFSLIIILATYKYQLFNGDSDVLLFIFLLFGAKFMNYLYQLEKKENQFPIIVLLLGIGNILLWVKQEGIVFFIFLIFSIIIFNKLINKKNKLILIISYFILILFRFLILKILDIPAIDTEWNINPTNALYFNFQEFYHKTINILFYIFVFLIQSPIYLITLPLMIISIKFLKNDPLNKTLLLFTFLIFSFLFATYFSTREVIFNLKYSMGEVMNSFSGIYLLAISNIFNKYFSNNKNKFLK